jgi:D-3-phosphoglycerate dehydrogenase
MDGCVVIAQYGIDVDEATANGIVVTDVPDYYIDEVSDHALALLLSRAWGDAPRPQGSLLLAEPLDARPLYRLRDRTIGLVVFGRIQRALMAQVDL